MFECASIADQCDTSSSWLDRYSRWSSYRKLPNSDLVCRVNNYFCNTKQSRERRKTFTAISYCILTTYRLLHPVNNTRENTQCFVSHKPVPAHTAKCRGKTNGYISTHTHITPEAVIHTHGYVVVRTHLLNL